jgi:hypothetical protein
VNGPDGRGAVELELVTPGSVQPGLSAATRLMAVERGGPDDPEWILAVLRDAPASEGRGLILDVLRPERVGVIEAGVVVDAALELADGGRLCVTDELVRAEARSLGCVGGLREPWLAMPASRGAPEPVAVEAAVEAFLPGTEVRRRRSLFGVLGLVATRAGAGSVRVRLPRSGALMAEPIAAAVDTLLAVRARFGRAAVGMHALSFDNGGVDLSHGNTAGQAEGASGVIVVAPSYVAGDAEGEVRRVRRSQGRSMRPAVCDDRPMLRLDEVVAHECWHYLDAEIRTSGSAYVEFHRVLGEALGVDSLELALRGRERDAPPAWQAAHVRLVHEVSAYGATSPREATAEMFSRWWCGEGSPVVSRFGELVEQLFPRAA